MDVGAKLVLKNQELTMEMYGHEKKEAVLSADSMAASLSRPASLVQVTSFLPLLAS